MANDTAKRLRARIKELRQARGLTQEAFAERAGLTYKHYQQVESGDKFDIRLSTLIKLAYGLGLKLSDLLDFDAVPMATAENLGKYDGKAVSVGTAVPTKSQSLLNPKSQSRVRRTNPKEIRKDAKISNH